MSAGNFSAFYSCSHTYQAGYRTERTLLKFGSRNDAVKFARDRPSVYAPSASGLWSAVTFQSRAYDAIDRHRHLPGSISLHFAIRRPQLGWPRKHAGSAILSLTGSNITIDDIQAPSDRKLEPGQKSELKISSFFPFLY